MSLVDFKPKIALSNVRLIEEPPWPPTNVQYNSIIFIALLRAMS